GPSSISNLLRRTQSDQPSKRPRNNWTAEHRAQDADAPRNKRVINVRSPSETIFRSWSLGNAPNAAVKMTDPKSDSPIPSPRKPTRLARSSTNLDRKST